MAWFSRKSNAIDVGSAGRFTTVPNSTAFESVKDLTKTIADLKKDIEPRNIPTVHRAVGIYTSVLGGLKFKYAEEDEPSEDDPLLRVLNRRPNELLSARDFKSVVLQDLFYDGNSIWLIVRAGASRVERIVRDEKLRARTGDDPDGVPTIVYRRNETGAAVNAGDVLHFHAPDSRNGLIGSPVTQTGLKIPAKLYAELTGKLLKDLSRDELENVVLGVKGGNNDAAMEKIMDRLKGIVKARKADRAKGEPVVSAVPDNVTDIHRLQPTGREMQLTQVLEWNARELAMVLGLNTDQINQMSGGGLRGGATFKEARRNFYEQSARDYAVIIEDELSLKFDRDIVFDTAPLEDMPETNDDTPEAVPSGDDVVPSEEDTVTPFRRSRP